jgi:tetratricopeptide (TPR) repeat protein
LRRLGLIRWTVAAFLLFLLPGALSPNLETFRVAQVLPLLLFVTALGIHAMVGLLPSSNRLWVLVGLFTIIGAFDFNLLATPYRDIDAHPENFGRPLKSQEKYHAYRILNSMQKKLGQGNIFANFDTNSFNDPTLSVMTYPFNTAENYKLGLKLVKQDILVNWTAVFVNTSYEPFLQKRFPDMSWFHLSEGLNFENSNYSLGIIYSNYSNLTKNKEIISTWFHLNTIFLFADRQRFLKPNSDYVLILQILENAYNFFPQLRKIEKLSSKNDPFLESVYWDKRAAYEYENLNYEEQLRSYQMAVTRGYPTADLYYKLGQLLLVKKRYSEAQEAFLKATQAPLDLTQAHAVLEWLKAQPSINPPNNSK